MDIPGWMAAVLLVAGLLCVTVGLFVYGRIARRIALDGGKVRADNFGPWDLMVAGLLGVWFVSLILRGFGHTPRPVRSEDMAAGVILFLLIVTLICSSLHFRGVNLAEQFGLRRLSLPKTAGRGIALLFAALPLVACVSLFTQYKLGTDAQPQELVKYFVEAARKSNYTAIVTTMIMAVICAPLEEELIFRGYFYGVLKRYFGRVFGILVSASLFAAIHLSETSLPSLFVLAVCFTIAYEFTGSLLVSICMHSLFNLANLFILLYASRHFVT